MLFEDDLKRANWIYLGREVALFFLWTYAVLVAGTFTGFLSFQLMVASAILGTMLLGGWLLWRLWQRAGLPRSGIEIALVVFLLSQVLALVFSDDPRRSLAPTSLWLVYALIFYFALDLLHRGWPVELIEKCLLIVGAIVLALAMADLWQLLASWRELTNGLTVTPSFKQRLFSVFGDANLLAAFINLLVPIALVRALTTNHKSSRVLIAGYLLASFLVLYFTGSRGGLLGLSAGLMALAAAWLLVVSKPAKKRVRAIFAALWKRRTLFFGAVTLLGGVAGIFIWRAINFQGDATHAATLDARDIYWQAALEAFTADPLTGAGPGIYPTYLMKIWSTPPARPFLHAHNTYFHLAAESGLIGFGGFVFLVVAVIRQSWTRLQKLDFASRARFAALAASLVGFGAHSLVDHFLPFLSAGAIVAVMVAILLASPRPAKKQASFNPLWLLIPATLGAALSINPLRGYAKANAAVDYSLQGNWLAAAEHMEAAAQLDPDLAFYSLQSGYAYGRLAVADPNYLDEALAAYQRGIELEPGYALNMANLSGLYFEADESQQALAAIFSATDLAPESWLFWLNRGLYEEEQNPNLAKAAYQSTLELNPEIVGSVFWNQNELREEVRNNFDLDLSTPETDRETASSMIAHARELIQAGELQQAESLIGLARQLNDQDVKLYIALAELSIAKGNLTAADQYLKLAIWVQSASNQPKVEAVLLRAELAIMWDDKQAAVALYRQAYDSYLSESSYGWGSYDWTPYAWFVFQRRAFPEDLLPQLVRADISPNIAERLLTLAYLYDERGEVSEAETVRTNLAEYLP